MTINDFWKIYAGDDEELEEGNEELTFEYFEDNFELSHYVHSAKICDEDKKWIEDNADCFMYTLYQDLIQTKTIDSIDCESILECCEAYTEHQKEERERYFENLKYNHRPTYYASREDFCDYL